MTAETVDQVAPAPHDTDPIAALMAEALRVGQAFVMLTGGPRSGKSRVLDQVFDTCIAEGLRAIRIPEPWKADRRFSEQVEAAALACAGRGTTERRVVLLVDDMHLSTAAFLDCLEVLASIPPGSTTQVFMAGEPSMLNSVRRRPQLARRTHVRHVLPDPVRPGTGNAGQDAQPGNDPGRWDAMRGILRQTVLSAGSAMADVGTPFPAPGHRGHTWTSLLRRNPAA